MKPATGDRISFALKGQQLTGTVVNEERGKLVLKLDTGYNIAVAPSELKDVKEENEKKDGKKNEKRGEHATKEKANEERKEIRDDKLPGITILHTGGTIASKVDYATGAVVAKFTAEEIVGLFPELGAIADISSTLIRNMQSDDMRFSHYNLIGEAVVKAIGDGAAGVIVTHGTDTLHYTAAALGFMLENVPIPVVLVGSQRSSDRGSSDAASNLIAACRFIVQSGAPGVYVCMHESSGDGSSMIIDGFHARKMHSSRRDAFRSVNAAPFVVVQDGTVVAANRAKPAGKLRLLPFNPKLKVGMVYLHPHLYAKDVESFDGYDGLVLLGTGLGHAPITRVDEFCDEHPKILKAVEALAKRMPVVMATQAIYGRVNMDVYSPGRALQEAGVLGQGCDMTPETAFIKLAWLLSNYPVAEARKLYGTSLRGEISARSDERGFEE